MKCEHTEEDEKESQTEGLEVDNEIQSETDFEEDDWFEEEPKTDISNLQCLECKNSFFFQKLIEIN